MLVHVVTTEDRHIPPNYYVYLLIFKLDELREMTHVFFLGCVNICTCKIEIDVGQDDFHFFLLIHFFRSLFPLA